MASRILSTLPDAPAVLRRMLLRAPYAAGRDAPDLRVSSPSETLGALFGLAGTLRMAEHLAAPPRPQAAAIGQRPDVARWVGERTAAIRLEAIAALAAPYVGPNAVPDADALTSALVAAGALGSRQRRRWEKAGKALGPRYARLLGAVVAHARKRLAWARADVFELLRQGPHDDALVAFDIALSSSIEAGVVRAMTRAEASLSRYFVEALVTAGKRLGTSAGASDVAIWLERGGWVEVYLGHLGELALGLIDREVDVLRALVAGALAPVYTEASR